MMELTFEESLCTFMTKIAKRHNGHSNLIKEVQVFMNFALKTQQASIKALEIQVRQMSIILHEKLFRNLQNLTKIMPNTNYEMISTSVKADTPSKRSIDASQYAVSNLQNRNLFFESKKTSEPSPSRLNDDNSDESKNTDEENNLEAHYTNTEPLGKAFP
nr:hypothetical protein [Tanacetum cinerariifolium]